MFNIAQVDGYAPKPVAPLPETERFAHADAFIDALKIPVTFGAYDAHYRIDLDPHLFMPPFAAFREAAGYYGTLIHEAAHGSGATHRLDRNFNERFGRDAVAIEEATAELTASFVLADLGIALHPRPDHAADVASWLRVLRDDPRAIFTAPARARRRPTGCMPSSLQLKQPERATQRPLIMTRHPASQRLCRSPPHSAKAESFGDRLGPDASLIDVVAHGEQLDRLEATMCKVLNKHKVATPAGAVYIGRGSKWGNPFKIGQHGDRAAVIAKHKAWLRGQHELLRSIGELRGKDLVCFCAPAACHGDLLLRLANGSREDMITWWKSARS